jgi:hypothetical protein
MDYPILYKIRPKTEVPSPIFINKHTKRNTDTCYAYGKTEHKHIFHSDDSFQINEQSQSELVEIFNNYSYFINYDALNGKMFMSVLCGCITIIIPEPNVTKIDWLKKTPAYNYLQENKMEGYYGIAYGFEELEWAETTISQSEEQWNKIICEQNKICYDSFITIDETKIIEKNIDIQIKYGINETDSLDITDLVMKTYYNKNIITIPSNKYSSLCPSLCPGITKFIFFSCIIEGIEKKRCYMENGEDLYIDFTKIKDFDPQKKIVIYTPGFEYNTGGIVCLHYLGQLLSKYGYNVFIRAEKDISNPLINKFYNNNIVDDDTIVIYPEIYEGNILNAKNVIRWILGPIRVEKKEIVKTWNKQDLVYYFNEEPKITANPDKKGSIYKMLSPIFLNPLTKNKNSGFREENCYTIRKTYFYKNITYIHPSNAFEITHQHDQIACIDIFNNYKFFVCYDPLCFLIVIAAICGCIPIVYPIEGVSKKEWINTLAVADYCKEKGIDNVYGIAYGQEDIEWAKTTLQLAKPQWDDIIKFNMETNVETFIEDLKKWDTVLNTVENNYFK